MADLSPVVVDTHTHVIAEDLSRYPLDEAVGVPHGWVHESPVNVTGLLAELNSAGVHAAVLVQARGAYGYDNAYVADARHVDPHRLVNAAVIDLTAADRVEQLRYWVQDRGVLGLRLFNIPAARPAWIEAPETISFLRAAGNSGVRLSLCSLAQDLPAIAQILAGVPDVPIALDHCAFVDLTAGLQGEGAQALAGLGVYANVRLKVTTTLFELAGQAALDPRDVLEWLCGVFGAERLMWGSDYPQYHRKAYPEIVDLGRHAASRLTRGEQARFLGGTALELWPELLPASADGRR